MDRLEFKMSDAELLTDYGRSADNDWIAKLTPLLIVDLVSLSLLLRGWSILVMSTIAT